MQTDEDLISKYYDCDNAAFEELKRRYGQKLYAFLRTRGVADRDIPDCVKETWFRIGASAPGAKMAGRMGDWVPEKNR